MSLKVKAVIHEKYAPCNARKILEGYFPESTSGFTKITITPTEKGMRIKDSFTVGEFDVENINDPIGGSYDNNIGHYLAMQANWNPKTYEPLFENGYNIFQENKKGFSVAHNMDVHKYYYIWLSRKFNISIDEINKEFEEYGNENPSCRIANLISRARCI